jgi:hypothetical protein
VRAIDTEIVEALCTLLKPYKDVTMVMSTESSSSISLIRPLLKQLMALCDNTAAPEMAPAIHEMRQTLYNDLEAR